MLSMRTEKDLLTDEVKRVLEEFCAEYDCDILIYSNDHTVIIDLNHDEYPHVHTLEELKEHVIEVYTIWIDQADKDCCAAMIKTREKYIKTLEGTREEFILWHGNSQIWFYIAGKVDIEAMKDIFKNGFCLYKVILDIDNQVIENEYSSIYNGMNFDEVVEKMSVINF